MSSDFNYCEPPDVPEGMTLAEYRRAHATKRKPGWRARLLSLMDIPAGPRLEQRALRSTVSTASTRTAFWVRPWPCFRSYGCPARFSEIPS